MGTLKQDIKSQSPWIVKAFKADGLILDYTIESFKNIDRFFDLHSAKGKAKKNGRLAVNLGSTVFSIGSYIGETLIKNISGSTWVTDDEDPNAEIDIEVHLTNGTIIWPIQRVMKRLKNGTEDEIFSYGFVIAKECGLDLLSIPTQALKPWWKFW